MLKKGGGKGFDWIATTIKQGDIWGEQNSLHGFWIQKSVFFSHAGLRGGVCTIHAAHFQPSCSIYDSATGASREFQIWEILCGVWRKKILPNFQYYCVYLQWDMNSLSMSFCGQFIWLLAFSTTDSSPLSKQHCQGLPTGNNALGRWIDATLFLWDSKRISLDSQNELFFQI